LTSSVSVGAQPGSSGQITLTGQGTHLATTGGITVGGINGTSGGTGVLTINDGTSVTAGTLYLHAGGTVNLHGGMLTLDALGGGNGTFNWTKGTVEFNSNNLLLEANLDRLLGPAHVLGVGQEFATADGATLTLPGTLTVAGGRITASTMTNNGDLQFSHPASTVTVNTLTNNGLIRGTGKITGVVVNSVSGQIETETGQRLELGFLNNEGVVNLLGGEIQFNNVLTNAASTGAIHARNAVIRFDGGLTNYGSLNLSFGTSDVYGEITSHLGSRIVVSGGSQATFYDDVTNNNGVINVSAAGGLQSTAVFFGALSGNGVAGGGRVFIEGDARPGFSPGTMAFGGDVAFGPLSALEIELGGAAPGTQYDVVTVADELSLAGTLNVSLIGGFVPTQIGQEFTVATCAQRTGEFDTINLPINPTLPGLGWDVAYTPTSVTLTTTPSLPGDINLDGNVNTLDAALFTPQLGLAGGSVWTTGDFNADGQTTLADLSILQAHFGQSVIATSPAAVPEPATWAFAVIAALLIGRSRRA
jgi:hypothetical protein